MSNEERIEALEQQLGTTLSALQVIGEQQKNADLSAENQTLRQALANSIDALQKSVANATSKLDSYQQTTLAKFEMFQKTISNLQESDLKLSESVQKEIARLLPKLSVEIANVEKRLSESAETARGKMTGAADAVAGNLAGIVTQTNNSLVNAIEDADQAMVQLRDHAVEAKRNSFLAGVAPVAAIAILVLGIGWLVVLVQHNWDRLYSPQTRFEIEVGRKYLALDGDTWEALTKKADAALGDNARTYNQAIRAAWLETLPPERRPSQ